MLQHSANHIVAVLCFNDHLSLTSTYSLGNTNVATPWLAVTPSLPLLLVLVLVVLVLPGPLDHCHRAAQVWRTAAIESHIGLHAVFQSLSIFYVFIWYIGEKLKNSYLSKMPKNFPVNWFKEDYQTLDWGPLCPLNQARKNCFFFCVKWLVLHLKYLNGMCEKN